RQNRGGIMDVLKYTQTRCPELAGFLAATASASFNFDGDHPLDHSSYNHTHLWALEYWADHHQWIDLEYRINFVNYIFDCWRKNLRGYPSYKTRGYRVYLYEDLAPTVSVVAETRIGFPYDQEPAFVTSVRDVMALYVGRSWRDNWSDDGWAINPDTILKTIERKKGSIGKPAADALGIKVGELRKLIVNTGIDYQANKIRKKYKRRPADFSNEPDYDTTWTVFERRLPRGYK
ncbi:unnamed protein product, partial [marine sediment metagenome]